MSKTPRMGIREQDYVACTFWLRRNILSNSRTHSTIAGLPQAAVKESIERVRRAIINSGYAFPAHALLINLAPADVKKEGPALDLAIAIGVLCGTNFIQGDRH